MQPTYMPWTGYFNLIAQADFFVFLDDVQFEKSSWQNRNQILLNQKPHWITVPSRRLSLEQLINRIQIDDKHNWRKKHYLLLTHAYGKHPHFQDMIEVSKIILDESITLLANLNIQLIKAFAERLGLFPQFLLSSELNITGQRSSRLVKICQYLQCDEYLSPVGSTNYLAEDGVFENSPIRLLFQNYIPSSYPQVKQPTFISHLSILDILANLGWQKTLNYVKTGSIN